MAVVNEFKESQSKQMEKIQLDVMGVNQVDILRRLLLSEKRDVVVFGEGNFTFSMALASFRQSWDGITATCYEPISQYHPKPLAAAVVSLLTIRSCITNEELLNVTATPKLNEVQMATTILDKVKKVAQLPSPPHDTWQFGVDATNIPESLNVRGKVVWFQCPWNKDDVHVLIAKFLDHMGQKQNAGDYALIGIANMPQYVKEYRIQDLLDENCAEDRTHQYKFLGADKKMIENILRYGYHHKPCCTDKDVPVSILTCHVTLVFCKNI